MYSVTLKNIKGIKELEYQLPEKAGVYVLTGSNGCGKTSLLMAINRIGNSQALSVHFNRASHRDGVITYRINDQSVSYSKSFKNWAPQPKDKSTILLNYPYNKTSFLSTSGDRFYLQKDEKLTKSKTDVSDSMKHALNDILLSNKFNNLQYIKVKSIKGRQKQLHRNNKLYVLKNEAGKYYSELDFSLGERLLLNICDYLEDVQSKSLLMIDEIELALHPMAQARLYDYLSIISREKDLIVIISTHSSTLVKKAQNLQYLENNNGKINVLNNIKAAYVLKDISIELDNRPDYIFFVEDKMAQIFLNAVLIEYKKIKIEDMKKVIQVVPVGGYEQVITLMTYFYGISPFSPKCLHSFLDKDVEDSYNVWLTKANRSASEQKLLDLFNENKRNFDYLSITPELGVWTFLNQDNAWFDRKLSSKYPGVNFSLSQLLLQVNTEEKDRNQGNLRTHAKGCLKNLFDKLKIKQADITVDVFYHLLIEAYVEENIRDQNYKNYVIGKIKQCLQ